MKKSYCYWPVLLKGLESEAHITCNWFGKADPSLELFEGLILGLDTRFHHDGRMVPSEFNRHTHVLEFLGPSEATVKLSDALTEIKARDYLTFRPHITVPYDYWVKCVIDDQPLASLIEDIGPLTLKKDGVIVGSWTSDGWAGGLWNLLRTR